MKDFKWSDKSLESLWKIVEYLLDKVEMQQKMLHKIYEYHARRKRDKDQPQRMDQG